MEIFECSNCYNRNTLDPHGRCSRCGSNAVVSLHRLHQKDEVEILNDLFTHHELEVLFGIVLDKVGKA